MGKQFVAAGAEYDKERGSITDVNDFATCNAYGVRYDLVILLTS